jgi:predicted NUDIX family phosphoesterase
MAQVFVVDRAAFFGGAWPQGFVPLAGAAAASLLADACARGRFVDRALAEATPAWKQCIPYCVLRCSPAGQPFGRGAHDGVFAVRRTKGQSEARLHGAWSIGIGGHVEPVDGAPAAALGATFFLAALGRELAEELELRHIGTLEPRFLGLLNDDSTEVGAVHAGLVYAVDVELPVAAAAEVLRVRERSKMRGGFTHLVEFQELWQNPAQFESWSQLLVRAGIAGPMGGLRANSSGDPGG